MAKLRDTAVRDNLNIAGTLTASGKQLSVEGHTHTPANITGLDTYITQKIQAAGSGSDTSVVTPSGDINAKTLDGHPVSDFVLKTESGTSSGTYMISTIITAASLKLELSTKLKTSNYLIKIESEELIIEFDNVTTAKRIIYKKPTVQFPMWKSENSNFILYVNNISTTRTKLNITVSTDKAITENDLIITEIYNNSNTGYTFVPDTRTAMYLGYDIYHNTVVKDKALNIVKPKKLISNNNTLVVSSSGGDKIIDIDNDMVITILTSGSIRCTKDNSIIVKSTNSGYSSRFLISGLSDNIIVAYKYFMPMFVDDDNIGTLPVTPIIDSNKDSLYPQLTMELAKKISSNSGVSISATINGVQFDGKTNITTPASKLITPVHINGIEFDGSQDITIPAPTNALTLGGLDSSQYIKATDIGNTAGKIPRFDNDGFLVYPDGSKERIENA